MNSRTTLFLSHALECIAHIEEFTGGDQSLFLNDRKTTDAVLRNLEVLGQCLKDYGLPALEQARPDIRWQRIGGFRNMLAHEYMALDLELIWDIIIHHLPPLRQAIAEQLERQP